MLGSAVVDHVVRVHRFPKPGESVLGWDFAVFSGGKGANQAVAASRLGARVSFAGMYGKDSAAELSKSSLSEAGVDLSLCRTTCESATGVATITLDASGQNTICVALGSNLKLTPTDSVDIVTQSEFDVFITQFEIPIDTIWKGLKASSAKIKILNPAPPTTEPVPDELWTLLTVVTPNEHEVEAITGHLPENESDCENAARWFLDRGVKNVVITLGARGCFAHDGKEGRMIPTLKVSPIDTVGAGDSFNGALAFALGTGVSIFDAAQFANSCAALSTLKMGAQTGCPTLAELPEGTTNCLGLG